MSERKIKNLALYRKRMQATGVSLGDIVNAICYEITMFRFTGNELLNNPNLTKPELRGYLNALIESFVVHTRVLIYFFYDNPKKDDISAKHFIDEWEKIRLPQSDILKTAKNKADKQLAHLTYARLTTYKEIESKKWKIREISVNMESVLQTFIDKLPGDKKNLFLEGLKKEFKSLQI